MLSKGIISQFSKRKAQHLYVNLSLKQDCQLYASLYVACPTRESDLSDFFHENYSYPPVLSKFGKLNRTNKYDTISILKKLEASQRNVPEFGTIIFDGAAVVQIASLKTPQTLQQYCRNELHSFLMYKIEACRYCV